MQKKITLLCKAFRTTSTMGMSIGGVALCCGAWGSYSTTELVMVLTDIPSATQHGTTNDIAPSREMRNGAMLCLRL